jgi:uncharacterized pyridoxamine 5'-phosphate oxidase family protein
MNPADYSSQNNDSIISSNNESTLPSTHDSIYLVGINSNDVYKQLQKAKYNLVSNETNKAVIEGFDTTPCTGDACFTQIGNNITDISNNFSKFSKNKNDITNGYTDLSNNIDSYKQELNNYTNGEDNRTYTQRLLDKTPTLKEARRDDTEKLFEQEKIFYAIGSITAVSLLIGAILLAKK